MLINGIYRKSFLISKQYSVVFLHTFKSEINLQYSNVLVYLFYPIHPFFIIYHLFKRSIIGGANLNVEDMNGRNCLHIAAYHGDKNLPTIIDFVQNIDAQVNIYKHLYSYMAQLFILFIEELKVSM